MRSSRGLSSFDGWCVSGMCGSISALGEMLGPPLPVPLACSSYELLRGFLSIILNAIPSSAHLYSSLCILYSSLCMCSLFSVLLS